jgi:hypothetical protein
MGDFSVAIGAGTCLGRTCMKDVGYNRWPKLTPNGSGGS